MSDAKKKRVDLWEEIPDDFRPMNAYNRQQKLSQIMRDLWELHFHAEQAQDAEGARELAAPFHELDGFWHARNAALLAGDATYKAPPALHRGERPLGAKVSE